MRRSWGSRAFATVGGALALGLVVAGPASAAELDWELQYENEQAEESRFTDVGVSDDGGRFAVGIVGEFDVAEPVAYRWDDGSSSWRKLKSPQERGVDLTGVDVTGKRSAWMVMDDSDSSGGDDAVLHWKQGKWTTHRFAGSGGGDVAALSDDDVWFVSGTADGTGVARHFDGEAWTTTALPGDGADHISEVAASADGGLYAVGTKGDQPYAAHWDGSTWSEVSPDPVDPPGGSEGSAWLSDVAVVDGEVWASGLTTSDDGAEGLLYSLDGTKFVPQDLPDMQFAVDASELAEGPDGALWLAPDGGSELYRRTADGWEEATVVPQPTRTATGVDALASDAEGNVWAVGTSEKSDVEFHAIIYQGS